MDVSKGTAKERIILGLDPGTNIMGYGVVIARGKNLEIIQFGVIHLGKYGTHELKLKKIFERITGIIEEFLPDEVVLEAPFFGKNIQSTLKLGRAQGVAMAAALARDIPITEYSPRKIKQAVTGNGNASKEQVAHMLQKLLQFSDLPKLLDASDALAVAVCHFFQNGLAAKSTKSWKSFLADNPDRIKN